MADGAKSMRGGLAWLLLILLPAVLILAGLLALFIWQGSKGGISPKWRKPADASLTNPGPKTLQPPPTSP